FNLLASYGLSVEQPDDNSPAWSSYHSPLIEHLILSIEQLNIDRNKVYKQAVIQSLVEDMSRDDSLLKLEETSHQSLPELSSYEHKSLHICSWVADLFANNFDKSCLDESN